MWRANCPVFPDPKKDAEGADRRTLRARALIERAQRKLKAAALLESGGFAEEARTPVVEAACLAVRAMAARRGVDEPADPEAAAATLVQSGFGEDLGGMPHGIVGLLAETGGEADIAAADRLLDGVVDAINAGQNPAGVDRVEVAQG